MPEDQPGMAIQVNPEVTLLINGALTGGLYSLPPRVGEYAEAVSEPSAIGERSQEHRRRRRAEPARLDSLANRLRRCADRDDRDRNRGHGLQLPRPGDQECRARSRG